MSTPIYKRSDAAIFAEVGGDVVALHVQRGQCYGMEKVSATVWNLLDEPMSIEAICTQLVELYDVEIDVCQSEIQKLLDQLQTEGMIERIDLEARRLPK